jgi:hypothetical protein
MNIAHSLPSSIASVSFSFLTTSDIRRISVKQIVNPVLLDDLNRPNIGGLYDPALGPSDKHDLCLLFAPKARKLSNFPLDVLLASSHTSHVPDTLVTLNFLRLYFIHYLSQTCIICSVELAYFAISLRLAGQWYVC